MNKKENNIETVEAIVIESTDNIVKTELNETQVIKKQSFLIMVLSYKPILYFFFFVAIFTAFILTKDYLFSILSNNDNKTIVHKDTTTVLLDNKGFNDQIKLDKEKATKVIISQLDKLESYKSEQSKEFLAEIETILDDEFKNSFNNAKIYADWFYEYTTQYKILYQSGKGIVNDYRVGLSDFKIKDAAINQVNDYISTKYKDLVLKPHLLEPSLKLKIDNLISSYINNKDEYIRKINNKFEIYLAQNPDKLSKIALNEIQADWKSNILNSKNLITLKGKSAEGALAVGVTSVVGAKIASGTAGKAMASNIIAKFGFKKAIASMSAKVALAPFTLGLSLVIGFLVDSSLNEMDESLTRDSFIADVNKNLNNMKNILYFEIEKQYIIQSIYNQDINLFKDFINNQY
ncbi:MAG: hypothetical protein U9O24_07205 [Campylobacterota bacterium]|nr:hypothetical protein [Campylobacterota bacterium]